MRLRLNLWNLEREDNLTVEIPAAFSMVNAMRLTFPQRENKSHQGASDLPHTPTPVSLDEVHIGVFKSVS